MIWIRDRTYMFYCPECKEDVIRSYKEEDFSPFYMKSDMLTKKDDKLYFIEIIVNEEIPTDKIVDKTTLKTR